MITTSAVRRAGAVVVLLLASTAGAAPASAAPVARPVIVIDPGHSVPVRAVDRRTGLVVSDYRNSPEMRDVFDVAQRVAARLRHDGYRVVLTKTRLNQRRNLAERAAIANRAHAALALSIHDQAGRDGGVTYRAGNNIVYYQSVGSYRVNRYGHRVVFRDHRLERVSKRYARSFVYHRTRTQHTRVRMQRNVGYDLGSRGLPAGNMWIVQLLSNVPWIYNEAGGNSAGRIGLNAHDRANYAASLVDSVEACVPVPEGSR